MIDPKHYGVSFSANQCRNFNVEPSKALAWLIKEAGFRRFRLMSYWSEYEKHPGKYDFKQLDSQIKQIAAADGVVTLCLGARQPRWPENHWPQWAWEAQKSERTEALLKYIETVVTHYKNNPAVISYQLENEALLESFGNRSEVDRKRLRDEYKLVKQLNPEKPVIMTTSTSWGIPLRRPIPDIVGFSYYQVVYNKKKQKYTTAFHTPLLHRTRALLIKLTTGKPVFIHELQLEPWGPKIIWNMTPEQQDESMGSEQIKKNLELARAVHRYPIDLWGAEWWYWRTVKLKDRTIWEAVKQSLV